jgi:hypothetical protein
MDEYSQNYEVLMMWVKDFEDDMQVAKSNIDVMKIQLSSLEREIQMLESLVENTHNQLEDLGGWVDGFVETT